MSSRAAVSFFGSRPKKLLLALVDHSGMRDAELSVGARDSGNRTRTAPPAHRCEARSPARGARKIFAHTFVPTKHQRQHLETDDDRRHADERHRAAGKDPDRRALCRVDCHTNTASASCAATKSTPVKIIVSTICPSMLSPSVEMSGGSHQMRERNTPAETSAMTETATANNFPTVRSTPDVGIVARCDRNASAWCAGTAASTRSP